MGTQAVKSPSLVGAVAIKTKASSSEGWWRGGGDCKTQGLQGFLHRGAVTGEGGEREKRGLKKGQKRGAVGSSHVKRDERGSDEKRRETRLGGEAIHVNHGCTLFPLFTVVYELNVV